MSGEQIDNISSKEGKPTHILTHYTLKQEKVHSPAQHTKQHSFDTISHSSTSTGSIASTGSITSTGSLGICSDCSPPGISPTSAYSIPRPASDPGADNYQSPPKNTSPLSQRKGFSHESLITAPDQSLIMATEVVSVAPHSPGPGCTDISELLSSHPNSHTTMLHQSRPLILQHPPHSHEEGSNGSYINWLCELYPSVLGSPNASIKEKLSSFQDSPTAQSPPTTTTHIPPKLDFTHAQVDTVFRSQEKYVVTLGAPISIAQRMGEDTLTYLNKGQFYSLFCQSNLSMSAPELVKSIVYLTFFDESDSRVEYNNWQYWYSQQANPNQKSFDIDRKACENMQGKPEDLAYNAASFVWRSELGAKLVLRINCLSTEFSSQKGVKGYPLHMVVDTYETVESDNAEPVHRAYCKVKIFRDKGAERKNKDETKNLDRRMQKFMKQRPGVSMEPEVGPSSVFHPPSKETALTSTSTFGPKPFLFVPEQVRLFRLLAPQDGNPLPTLPPSHRETASFLANIKERETKRTISNILSQAKEDLNHLEVGAPAKKAARVPDRPTITVYVRKEEEKVYNALLLDSLTIHDLKLQIGMKYDIPPEMIKNVFKKTKKGLLVYMSSEMIFRFEDEDDFIIELPFDNQKGCFDLYIRY